MINHLLANFWRLFALLLVCFLGIKFYTALNTDFYAILSIAALLVLFYALFLLEGLQIAGFQLKEHCDEAILRYLETSRKGDDQRTLRIAELYKNSFHSFLAGRQILVIMSVVSIASIISAIKLEPGLFDFVAAAELVELMNSPVTNFLLSTLLPAWISQLLPQFIADNRSIGFVSLPATEWVTRLAIQLDKIHASRPAFDLLKWARRSHAFGVKEKIHVGRKRFFESLSSYIGVSRDKVSLVMCGDSVTERSTYHIRKEKLVILRHKIRPQGEIDQFNITLSTKESVVTGKPFIEKSYDRSGLFYMLEIALSFDDEPLEGYADVIVINEYRQKGMAGSGTESILFETDIPTRTCSIILMPDRDQKISEVSVDAYHYTQRRHYDDDSFAYGVVELSSDGAGNHRIDIEYPLYGIEYRIAYQHHRVPGKAVNEASERCALQLKSKSMHDSETYTIQRFALSTAGLGEPAHLNGEAERHRKH